MLCISAYMYLFSTYMIFIYTYMNFISAYIYFSYYYMLRIYTDAYFCSEIEVCITSISFGYQQTK